MSLSLSIAVVELGMVCAFGTTSEHVLKASVGQKWDSSDLMHDMSLKIKKENISVVFRQHSSLDSHVVNNNVHNTVKAV
jgi:hypothetical protein